jgi:hypothetical protein
LPHPFPPRDRASGYRYQLSILQAEFSLTQVLDQPVTGRIFFEEVIRENLDIGRPSQVSLIFDRKINRCPPGRFRTRVITDGVVPSLHIDYKKSHIKQYHKLLLRTETTINDTRDFGIGRRIENLAELRKIGFAANRRLLDVQRIGRDCFVGEAAFQDMQKPASVGDQRAASLRFADPRSSSFTGPSLVPSRPGHIHPQGPSRASCSTAGEKAQPTHEALMVGARGGAMSITEELAKILHSSSARATSMRWAAPSCSRRE